MHYKYKPRYIESSLSRGRGSSTVSPKTPMNLREIVAHMEARPNDKFMFCHLYDFVEQGGLSAAREAAELFKATKSQALFGLLVYMPGNTHPFALEAMNTLSPDEGVDIFTKHPISKVREMTDPGFTRKERWQTMFSMNRDNHVPFGDMNLTLSIPIDALKAQHPILSVKALTEALAMENPAPCSHATGTSLRAVEPEETFEKIFPHIERLVGENPLTIIHSFNAFFTVLKSFQTLNTDIGRHNHSLSGTFGANGKGLTKTAALCSGAMELIERHSAKEGVGEGWPSGYKTQMKLRSASAKELKSEGLKPLDPNSFNLPFPYYNEALNWVEGTSLTKEGDEKVLVPAQAVFEFTNLDEPEVFFSTSNGLASGNSMDEAKLHALLEIIERDGDYTMFYRPDRVFALRAKEPPISGILSSFEKFGLNVHLLDLTTEFEVPIYRAFVKVHDQILSGSGAHLDGRIAAARAIGELVTKVFIFTQHNPSLFPGQFRADIGPALSFEDLPNFSSGNIQMDLMVIEALLIASGFPVNYVDLTREDLDIPVVRALVPGLDIPKTVSTRMVMHLSQLPDIMGLKRTEALYT